MHFTTNQILIAFGLTLFAGLSTCIGGAMAFFTKRTNMRFLSVAIGFSAGVMLYVSFVEILKKANESFLPVMGEIGAGWMTFASFFGGILLIMLIDKFVPEVENPHEMHKVEEIGSEESVCPEKTPEKYKKLAKTGVIVALAVSIHNFPEGLATFVASLKDLQLGIPIAVAIAIHNIPEGIAVAVPLYYATGNRKKAFWFAFLSGLAEPIGAIIGFFLLYHFLSDHLIGVIFGMVAGIMVYISLDELLPSAEEYGEHHLSIYGLTAGMAIMAISLILFKY